MAACGDSEVLLQLVREIAQISGAGGSTFRRSCADLVRRVALLVPLFEEIRDSGGDLGPFDASTSSSSSSCFSDLAFALQACKRLLATAGDFDPSVSSDEEAKKISFQFQCVTWKLQKALGGLPYDHFDISEEVQEQVELVRAQLRRATEGYGPLNSRVISRALSEPDLIKSASRLIETPQARALHRDGDELKTDLDTVLRGNCFKGCRSGQVIHASSLSSDIDGAIGENLAERESGDNEKTDTVSIPDDFLCPISLELMRDPVIVATGQTYEKSYIQRWIDSGNTTCPKTRQKLQHFSLTPNFVLRNLISQWCEEHHIEQPRGLANGRIKKSDGSYKDVREDIVAIEALVGKLSSQSIEECRAAVTEIRSLSKRSTDNRIIIAEAGAIPVLVKLLNSEDAITQENAVTSILNLSIYESNKELIMLANAIPSIIQVLRFGSMEARENAAATLFSLSLADENRTMIGSSGAIPALVELLHNGSVRGKKDAATALFNLCTHQANKGRAVRAGIITALLKMLKDSSSCMVDEALTILSVLASHTEAKVALSKASAIPVLIDLLRAGLPRNKENAAGVLLSLCKRDTENLACISRLGAVIPLNELARTGTERAKRKATSLLELLQKLQKQ